MIKVFTRQGDDGELKLASASVGQAEKKAFTTIANLYDMVRSLSFDLDPSMRRPDARPTDDVLEAAYVVVKRRLDELLEAAGGIKAKLLAGVSAKDLRVPKGSESDGHAFMRPVIQKAVTRIVCQIAEQGVLSWDTTIARLKALDWRIGQGPWSAVFNTANKKMVTAKENVGLLDALLYAHLAAPSKQWVIRARKEYKQVRGSTYPFSEEQLMVNLTEHVPRPIAPSPESAPAAALTPPSPAAEDDE